MIKFNAKNPSEFEIEVAEKATEISIETLKAVCNAIEEDVDIVSLEVLSNFDIDIIVKKENYLNALEINLQRAAAAEEFELCARAMGHIKSLKNGE